MSGAPEPGRPGRDASRLAQSRSAYLASAKEQAIDWFPWGPEPFELAKRTGRPILLDIGAVWCHWCHVMDEGTYADGEVARILAQHFVAIKVDRDEHPEVDRRYQRQVSALTGEGGWPLTAFLDAEGAVFLGGTYFPPQDGMGRPGFRRVLKEVARLYRDEPERIRENSAQIRAALQRMREHADRPYSETEFLTATFARIDQSFDPVNAGFGFAPKFPHPTAVSLQLWRSFATGDAGQEQRARDTLLRMADGGMYDQVGGGFHRYSVDEAWHIPHFEKMGVDNAALLGAYVEGARRFREPRFDDVIRGIASWTTEVLADPGGGFGSSQDADNAPGDDGGYFTWTRAELKSALEPAEFRLATRVFGVGSDGRMPHDPDRNVLFRLMPPAEAAEGSSPDDAERSFRRAVETLRRVRASRPTPVVDRALYADINGGFVRSFVLAGQYLGDAALIALGRRAADRFLAHAYDPDRGVAHRLDGESADGFGHLEDQAAFALGLIELAGATLERRYVDAATRLLELVDREYRGEDGLLKDVAPRLYDGPRIGSIDEPSYPLEDNPHLAANSATALAYERLAALVGENEYRTKAGRLLSAMHPRLMGAGLFASGAALASALLESEPARVVVVGEGPSADSLVAAARASYHPNMWVFRGVPPAPFSLPAELGAESATRAGGARALICFGTRCLAPVGDASKIPELLRNGARTPA
ncbi:MAG TPA: thioredoxin domain-containing protein [Thermoplasmata archaeon]|nr:thioredoxin domain-containing protein [Thermoplasmata archaeon]